MTMLVEAAEKFLDIHLYGFTRLPGSQFINSLARESIWTSISNKLESHWRVESGGGLEARDREPAGGLGAPRFDPSPFRCMASGTVWKMASG